MLQQSRHAIYILDPQVFRLDSGGRTGVTTLDITKTGLALDMMDTAMFTLLCKLVRGKECEANPVFLMGIR